MEKATLLKFVYRIVGGIFVFKSDLDGFFVTLTDHALRVAILKVLGCYLCMDDGPIFVLLCLYIFIEQLFFHNFVFGLAVTFL